MTGTRWLTPADVRATDAETLPKERRRLTGAALVSALGHAFVLALLIGLWAPAPEETHTPIPVTLRDGTGAEGAVGGGAGETAAAASSATSQSEAPAQTAATQAAPAQATTPQPADAAVTTPAAPTPPQTASAEALPTMEAAEPIPPRKPTPPRPPQIATATPAPTPPVPAASPPLAQGPATPAPSASSTATASADAPPESGVGGRGRGEEGAGRAAVGDGSLAALGDDYLDKVRRWLARYQKMPQEAAEKKQYGMAFVTIVIDRAGNVLDAHIDQSSGYPLLDDATLKMVHDASPLPKVPDSFKGAQLKFGLPANYRPGFFERVFH